MGKPATRVTEVHVRGPLAGVADGFKGHLKESGYTPLTSVNKLQLLAHLSRWLDAKGLETADLTEERIQEYVEFRRAGGCTCDTTRRALVPLLDHLAAEHLRPTPAPAAVGSRADQLLDSFHHYLVNERGLVPSTAAAYRYRADRFMASCAADGEVKNLCASDVSRAVLAELTALSVGAAQYFVAALRSFLRFCLIEGLVESDLSAAALSVTGRRHSPLPKGISKIDADALLKSCDRRRAIGRRDRAILMTLLRLGLRAGEVAGLLLDDIDWRAGELVVHGKGGRHDRLPLPADVGDAVADYLQRGRPKTTRREVFLRALAPIAGLDRGGVGYVVRRACSRAGVAPVGPHRLRHTLATEMVNAGVSLTEIGQVLRHRNLSTTAIYARVDLDHLRLLARPWLGSAGR